LSIKKIGNDLYEVGVHIADVSYFVDENTPLDKEAQLRTTSVYMVHRVLPMLPRLLCENLCSLNPSVERLAVSVYFKMNTDGDVLWKEPIRIGRSIIKSCCKFSYDTV
jgi:DIS3-like exonuclease 2